MKKLAAALAAVCLFVTSPVLRASEPASGKHGLQAVDSAWVKAMLANDVGACGALYADDAVLVLPGTPAIKGRTAITAAYSEWLAAYKVTDAAITDATYESAGDVSAGWGAWRLTMEPKAGGAPVTQVGRWCAVAKKQQDGSWKYAADQASEDPAPATMK